MTDTDNKIPAASPCPDCRALIPATTKDRVAHNEWHADLASKHRGVQKRIGELSDVASRAADAASKATREVSNIEIPEPVEPMRFEEWPADELPQATDDEDDQPVSTYTDENINATIADPVAGEPAEHPTDVPAAIDRDDTPTYGFGGRPIGIG